jgi:hypothetical protein
MKPRTKPNEPRLKEQDTTFLLKLSTALKARLEQEAAACGISLSELIRRRCESQDLPRTNDKKERLTLLALNVMERISRDIRRAQPITAEHLRILESLLALVNHIAEH